MLYCQAATSYATTRIVDKVDDIVSEILDEKVLQLFEDNGFKKGLMDMTVIHSDDRMYLNNMSSLDSHQVFLSAKIVNLNPEFVSERTRKFLTLCALYNLSINKYVKKKSVTHT